MSDEVEAPLHGERSHDIGRVCRLMIATNMFRTLAKFDVDEPFKNFPPRLTTTAERTVEVADGEY